MDAPATDVAVFILAGGKSTRMGADKAFVRLAGRTLLDRALDLARSVTPDVRIVGKAGDTTKFQSYAPLVEDIFHDCGPLAGIHAALRSTAAEFNVMLAVDVPFVNREVLEFLVARARRTNATVTVAEADSRFQPLCAVYRREFGGIAEKALQAGRYKIDALFGEVRAEVVTQPELQARGFSSEMFRNLNTPDELAEAIQEGARD